MVSGTRVMELDELVELDSVAFAESEVMRIEAHIRRLRGRQAELLAELDTHQIASADGARTMADWVSSHLDLSPQAASRLMTVARSNQAEIRRRMLAGSWGIDRAAVVAKLAAAGLPADQLMETADTFSLGRLYVLLERTRRLDAESESFDYDWRYLVCQPSLDESVFKLWGQLPGTDGQVVLNALSARETELPSSKTKLQDKGGPTP